jgi:hypothetical protein
MQTRVFAALLPLITALSFFVFPGRTILESDTQIYLPILEHLWDPTVLARDLVAVRPHVTYTLYDDIALLLRKITSLDFETVLVLQQIVWRFAGHLGAYLIALAVGLPAHAAFLVAGIAALGGWVYGPAVLLVEVEPVPRGFAVCLMLLSLGLVGFRRWTAAALALGLAFLYHPPTALALVVIVAALAAWRRQWTPIAILAAAALLLAFMAWRQPGLAERQPLFATIPAWLEEIQRFRAPYNWISLWIARWFTHYLVLAAVAAAAMWRLRAHAPEELRLAALALAGVAALALPISWLITEQWKLMLGPQYQVGRYLLYIPWIATIGGAIAGARAAVDRRYLEAAVFFCGALALPLEGRVQDTLVPDLRSTLSMQKFVLLVGVACLLTLLRRRPLAPIAVAAVSAAIALWSGAKVYRPRTPADLRELIRWAERETWRDALFQFADAGNSPEPGVFRARARRALYVDWKAGGQANFLIEFGAIWWKRWQEMQQVRPLSDYAQLGIDYVIFKKPLLDAEPVFRNATYAVYRATPADRASSSRTSASLVWVKSTYHNPTAWNGEGVSTQTISSTWRRKARQTSGAATGTPTTTR